MIFQVKNRKVLSISHLYRECLRFIFDEENMSAEDVRFMRQSIMGWHNAIRLEDEKLAQTQAADVKVFGQTITTEHKYSEQKIILTKIAKMLKDSQSGGLDRRKRLFKEKGVDYRKFYRIPESYTKEGLMKANIENEKYKANNPEQEGLV